MPTNDDQVIYLIQYRGVVRGMIWHLSGDYPNPLRSKAAAKAKIREIYADPSRKLEYRAVKYVRAEENDAD